MRKILTFLGFLILLSSCEFIIPSKKITAPPTADQILETDKQFSKRSAEKGMRKAYFEYMSDDAVLLRPATDPLKGAAAIDYLSLVNDEDYILTWEPLNASISASGDMGFSYGIYELSSGEEKYQGTYVNVWKKQTDGSWKFVLNAGNEGISPTDR